MKKIPRQPLLLNVTISVGKGVICCRRRLRLTSRQAQALFWAAEEGTRETLTDAMEALARSLPWTMGYARMLGRKYGRRFSPLIRQVLGYNSRVSISLDASGSGPSASVSIMPAEQG